MNRTEAITKAAHDASFLIGALRALCADATPLEMLVLEGLIREAMTINQRLAILAETRRGAA